MKKISDLTIKYVNIRPKLRGGSDKRDNQSMEKYFINYKKKVTIKKPEEYYERTSNNNQNDVRLTFMNCKGFVTQKNNQHK